jgi:hypothetical protein
MFPTKAHLIFYVADQATSVAPASPACNKSALLRGGLEGGSAIGDAAIGDGIRTRGSLLGNQIRSGAKREGRT